LGHPDLDIHDRLEEDRLRLGDALARRERSRESERELVRVDRVEGAVVEGRLEVDDGVAREWSLARDVTDAFLDAREELPGHDPTDDARLERDARAGVRLDLQPDVTELATTAGLLLVPALDPGG